MSKRICPSPQVKCMSNLLTVKQCITANGCSPKSIPLSVHKSERERVRRWQRKPSGEVLGTSGHARSPVPDRWPCLLRLWQGLVLPVSGALWSSTETGSKWMFWKSVRAMSHGLIFLLTHPFWHDYKYFVMWGFLDQILGRLWLVGGGHVWWPQTCEMINEFLTLV
jgi:hypothetical protein